MPILDPKTETASRVVLRQVQLERLQATVNRAYRHVTYYRETFDRAGILPENIRSLDDLARLPITTRDDLLAHQPYALFAVPLSDVLRLHPAAGAGGPVVVGYTQNDIATWTRMAARSLASAGVTREDVLQITLDYSHGSAAIGTQSGAEILGASVIPCSGLSPERQAEVMRHYRATVLAATPSQALRLGSALGDLDPASITLRIAFIVGEVWSDALREEIESVLPVEAFGSYGLSEMAVPGLATECECHCGLHVSEDNALAEVVDPETRALLPNGKAGELVLTTLTREAVPMIRYATGDLTVLDDAVCACGRTYVRMSPTHERTDDMVVVGGGRVSPKQIETVLHGILPDAPFRIHTTGGEGLENLEIRVGMSPEWLDGEMRRVQELRDRIETAIHEHLGVSAEIRLVETSRIDRPPRGGE
ncbi:AMP-binding protein [Candidatus Sumerlaeota bacterium]|nr:AMP-binding protein [Candidatus Sumerlaeota bacterium]